MASLSVHGLPSVSIHAPRAGSDCWQSRSRLWTSRFNPRSPRGERLGGDCRPPVGRYCFNPRSPRGERHYTAEDSRYICPGFNPRSPRGERLSSTSFQDGTERFQSTLPARGATSRLVGQDCRGSRFNPRSPRGERPTIGCCPMVPIKVSIHAPRAGSDESLKAELGDLVCFNPRSPRGERPFLPDPPGTVPLFQSTLPARGATRVC